MAPKRGLGKGLDSLIPAGEGKTKKGQEATIDSPDKVVNISKVEPNPDQPRKNFAEDELEELADSIKQIGIFQPILVQDKGDHYMIVAGERRWRAALRAGLKEVPVIIKNYTDEEIVIISLLENIQRVDLNPIEEAQTYKKLIDTYKYKQDEVAEKVSKSRGAVTNSMRLLKLADEVQQMLIDNLISSGHARALLAVDDKTAQYELAQRVMDEKLSVREIEKIIKDLNKPKKEKEVDRAKVEKMKNSTIMQIINEPIYLGLIMGTLLAFVAGQDVKTSFTTGMAMSALMYLLPRMVKILMEGLDPISEACQVIMSKKYAGESLYIGMDSAVCLGHTTTMLGAVIMIPICIAICMLTPGNRIIPMASLASIGYNVAMCTVAHKGKVFRTMLSGSILLVFSCLIGSFFAPLITEIALSTGYEMAGAYTLISCPSGAMIIAGIVYWFFHFGNMVGAIICVVIIVALVLWNRAYFKKKRNLSTREFVGTDASKYLNK